MTLNRRQQTVFSTTNLSHSADMLKARHAIPCALRQALAALLVCGLLAACGGSGDSPESVAGTSARNSRAQAASQNSSPLHCAPSS